MDTSMLRFPKPSRLAEKDAKRREDARAEAACYRLVDRRDGYCCRLCGRRGNPQSVSLLDRLHHHHVTERSRGGEHTSANVILVCAFCHDLCHKHRVRVAGDADQPGGLRVDRLVGDDWRFDGHV
jgi:hypothetical protein